MNTLERLEKYFNMPFDKIISDLHWKDGLSILELSNRSGVSRDSIYKLAKKFDLLLKTATQSAMDKYRHHDHWAKGLTKEKSGWARMHSRRMKKKNPMYLDNIALKRSETMQDVFSKNLLPQEIEFKNILDKFLIKYEVQKSIDRYNIDFFIPSLSLCIEIDSTSKWGRVRRSAAEKKDVVLSSLGFKILRINKNKLSDLSFINNILKANNII